MGERRRQRTDRRRFRSTAQFSLCIGKRLARFLSLRHINHADDHTTERRWIFRKADVEKNDSRFAIFVEHLCIVFEIGCFIHDSLQQGRERIAILRDDPVHDATWNIGSKCTKELNRRLVGINDFNLIDAILQKAGVRLRIGLRVGHAARF